MDDSDPDNVVLVPLLPDGSAIVTPRGITATDEFLFVTTNDEQLFRYRISDSRETLLADDFSNLFWDSVAVSDDGSKLRVADRDNGVTEFSLQDTSQSGSATLSFDGNAGEMVSFTVNGDTTATVTKVTGSGDTDEVVVSDGDLTSFNGIVGLDLAKPRTPRSAIPPHFSEVVAFVKVSSSEFNVGDSQTERENQTTTLDPLSSSVTVGEPGFLSGSASADASWDLNLDSTVEFDLSMASNVSSTSGSSRSHSNKYEYEFEVTEDMPITIDYHFDVVGTGHKPTVSFLLHREQQFNNDKSNNAVDSVTNISHPDRSEDGEGVSDTITFDTSAISNRRTVPSLVSHDPIRGGSQSRRCHLQHCRQRR